MDNHECEVIYVLELSKEKDFHLSKQRVYLPRSDETNTDGSCAILISKDKDSIDTFSRHPMVDSKKLFKFVYRNKMITVKIKSSKFYDKDLKAAKDWYSHCYDVAGLKNGLLGMHGKNFFYDTYPEQVLFFLNSTKLQRKDMALEWLNMMGSNILSFPLLELYPIKTMLFSIEEWKGNEFNPIDLIARLMRHDFEKFQKVFGDIDMLFLTDTAWFKMNPTRCGERSFSKFMRMINALDKTLVTNDWIIGSSDSGVEPSDMAKELIASNKEKEESEEEDLERRMEKIEAEEENEDENDEEEGKEKHPVPMEPEVDPEVLKVLASKEYEPVSIKKTAMSKRDEKLREEQKKLKIGNATLEDIVRKKSSKVPIPVNDVSGKLNTLNTDLAKVQFSNFGEVYDKELYEKDIVSVVNSMENKSIPVYIRKMEKEDTSDAMNAKYTYTFQLEDANRGRHTLKFDVPKFIEGKYLYINGHKKAMSVQRFMLPLVKIGPDTVQVVTNYNKIFMRRYGEKVEAKFEKFKNLVLSDKKNFSYVRGDCSRLNKEFETTIEYDTLAKVFSEITVKPLKLVLVFDQNKLKEYAEKNGLMKSYESKVEGGSLVAGYYTDRKELFFISSSSFPWSADIKEYEVNESMSVMDSIGDPFAYEEVEE